MEEGWAVDMHSNTPQSDTALPIVCAALPFLDLAVLDRPVINGDRDMQMRDILTDDGMTVQCHGLRAALQLGCHMR